jgi:hypothetical protein
MPRLAILGILAMLATGCVTVSKQEFDRVASGVKATKGDPPSGCTEIGSFDANGGAMGFGHAKQTLRYKVGKAGGNLVVMDVASTGATGNASIISGTGYRCGRARVSKRP